MNLECLLNPGGCFQHGLDGIGDWLVSWVPSWLWPLLPYWPWLAALIVVGVVWRFAGWPGLLALAGAAGFVLGRRSVTPEPAEHFPAGHPDPKPVAKPVVKPRPKTLADLFNQRKP